MKPYLISTGYVTSLLKCKYTNNSRATAERPFSSKQGWCLDSHSPRNGPSPQSRGGAWTLTRRGTALLLRAGVVLGSHLPRNGPSTQTTPIRRLTTPIRTLTNQIRKLTTPIRMPIKTMTKADFSVKIPNRSGMTTTIPWEFNVEDMKPLLASGSCSKWVRYARTL